MVRMNQYSRFFMEEAGDGKGGGGDGGGGTGSGGSDSGGGTGSVLGGSGGATGAGGSTAGAGSGGVDGGSKVVIPENWQTVLPEEIRSASNIKNFKTVEELAKSYLSAQKLIGADKIPVPNEHTSQDEWRAIYEKLGLPPSAEEYKYDLEKGVEVLPEFQKSFNEVAHKVGVLPKQAKAILEHFDKAYKEELEKAQAAEADQVKVELGALQKEWGEAYNDNVAKAKAALREFADEDIQKFILESGLGNNTKIIKLLSKVGEVLSEDKIRGDGGRIDGRLSPQQAQQEIDDIYKNPNHAYFNKNHESHEMAKRRVRELFEMVAPKKASKNMSIAN